MKGCIYAALLVSVLATHWSTSSAKKVKIGDLDRGDSLPDDDWDKELDEEWESWGKKIKEKIPEKESQSIEDMIAQLKNKEMNSEDTVFNTQPNGGMAFIRVHPERVKTKEEGEEIAARFASLQRTGGLGSSWYCIDKDTLLVQSSSGEDMKMSKDFALMQEEIYEFEFQQSKFRREEDTMTYDELLESLGLKNPHAAEPAAKKSSSPPPAKKSSKKSKKSKKSANKGKGAKEEL